MEKYENDGWMKPVKILKPKEPEPIEDEVVDDQPEYNDGYEDGEEGQVISPEAMKSIEKMHCPKCGFEDELDILGHITMRISKIGPTQGAISWAGDSPAHCPKCEWQGTFGQTQRK